MTYVAPTTHVAGETLPAADYNVMCNDIIAPRACECAATSTSVTYSNSTTTYTDYWPYRHDHPTFSTSKDAYSCQR
jgi:hypothetical protein